MVSYKEIQASNALLNDTTTPRISVFVGGTSGIGSLTIRALVSTGASLRIYLIGRKSSFERSQLFIKDLHIINPKAEVIWIEGEISLLSETKRICQVIKTKESSVDLLFLTAGYAPFGTRKETSEGIEITQSLEYYSRILFILHLLPCLSKAENPRVVSVLGGGMERANGIQLNDLHLRRPETSGLLKSRPHVIAMETTTMEKLSNENPNVTFIHSWPGAVNTGNVHRGQDPGSIWSWVASLILEPMIWLFSFTDEESGQRNLFQSTSAAFGGVGVPWKGKVGVDSKERQENGLFLVNYKCECTPNAKVMAVLRQEAQGKVWDHTQEVLKPYL